MLQRLEQTELMRRHEAAALRIGAIETRGEEEHRAGNALPDLCRKDHVLLRARETGRAIA